MPKFLKLSASGVTKLRINPEFIVEYYAQSGDGQTCVHMANGTDNYVHETVERIDAMLEELEKTND